MTQKAEFARRLSWAIKRKYAKNADLIKELERRGWAKRRTLYSHLAPNDYRMPNTADIGRYAEVLGVSASFLQFGEGAEAEAFRLSTINEGKSDGSTATINQLRGQPDLNSSHNPNVRFIVVLSAEQIRDLSTAQGDLARMSGQSIPVPELLNAGRGSFAYFVPVNDFSMVAASGLSFHPGACLIVDPERTIAPGDLVVADINGFDAPILRRYVGARPYSRAARFKLEAFNASFEPLEIADPDDVLFIGRVIWTGQQL